MPDPNLPADDADHAGPDSGPDSGPERVESARREPERDYRTGRSAAATRIAQQASWVDLQVRQAMERGEFDDLPGQGKPIADLGVEHDPDWWLKKLVERERLVVLPPSVQLRKEDAQLDAELDSLASERLVRERRHGWPSGRGRAPGASAPDY